jgi:hypothetical protein
MHEVVGARCAMTPTRQTGCRWLHLLAHRHPLWTRREKVAAIQAAPAASRRLAASALARARRHSVRGAAGGAFDRWRVWPLRHGLSFVIAIVGSVLIVAAATSSLLWFGCIA